MLYLGYQNDNFEVLEVCKMSDVSNWMTDKNMICFVLEVCKMSDVSNILHYSMLHLTVLEVCKMSDVSNLILFHFYL